MGKDSRALSVWQHGSPGGPRENRDRPELGFRRKHFQVSSRRGLPRKGIWEEDGLPFSLEWGLHQDTRVGGRTTAHWTAAAAPPPLPWSRVWPAPGPFSGSEDSPSFYHRQAPAPPDDYISATKTSAREKTRGCQEGPCAHPLASGGAGWPFAALPGQEPGAGPPDGVPTVAEGGT